MRPVDDWEFYQILKNVRAEDRLEFESINGDTLEHELRRAIDLSHSASAYVVDGKVVAAFGCIEFDENIGIPWLISTTAVHRNRRSFLQQCLIEVAKMRARHKALINYTDARYTLALRWMLWMGFEQQEAIPYGAKGELFHPFTMKGEQWAQQQD